MSSGKWMKVFKRYSRRWLCVVSLTFGVASAQAAGWISDTQASAPHAPLCQALLARLRSFSDRCAPDAVETYPNFANPPWENLDAKQHIDLIAKLTAYASGGPNVYFQKPIDLERFRAGARQFVAHGGELQVWHTRLLSFFGDSATKPAPPGDSAVLMMTTKVGAADPHTDCPGKTTKNWVRQTFIVLPDLSGPDPRVEQGTAYALQGHRPVIYKGEVLLIGGAWSYQGDTLMDGSASIFKNFDATGLQGGVCNLRFTRPRAASVHN